MNCKTIISLLHLLIVPCFLQSQNNIEELFVNDSLSTFIYIKDDSIACKLYSFGAFGGYSLYYGSYALTNNEIILKNNLIIDKSFVIEEQKKDANSINIILLEDNSGLMDYLKVYIKTISSKDEIKKEIDSNILCLKKDENESLKKEYLLVFEKFTPNNFKIINIINVNFGNEYIIKPLIKSNHKDLGPYGEISLTYNLRFDKVIISTYIYRLKKYKKQKLNKRKLKMVLTFDEDEQTLYRRKSNYNSVSEFLEKNLFNNAGFD
ncbi:MAG: hypothetical protein LBV69_11100 [Bacteroidales bacterium]|jgi:hypothetical protein|nr:hypothetical protein [Bacteroidales bacterium]